VDYKAAVQIFLIKDGKSFPLFLLDDKKEKNLHKKLQKSSHAIACLASQRAN
jgi:hypothetical protein